MMRIKNVDSQTRLFILVLKDQPVQRTSEVCKKKKKLRKGQFPLDLYTPQVRFPFLRFLRSAKVQTSEQLGSLLGEDAQPCP